MSTTAPLQLVSDNYTHRTCGGASTRASSKMQGVPRCFRRRITNTRTIHVDLRNKASKTTTLISDGLPQSENKLQSITNHTCTSN